MKVKELNKSKLPVVRIDNSLEKYKDKVLFKDKLDKANEMLKTTGLPKPRRQQLTGGPEGGEEGRRTSISHVTLPANSSQGLRLPRLSP
jgi:hypothetical protein